MGEICVLAVCRRVCALLGDEVGAEGSRESASVVVCTLLAGGATDQEVEAGESVLLQA